MSKLKLGTRFTLFLSAVFIGGTIIGGLSLWNALHHNAQNQISLKGRALIETMSSVRSYTSNQVAPLLQDDMDEQPEFVAETVPAFSARTVFEQFRQQDAANASFLYKEATLNPTNPLDQADDFETAIVNQMRSDATLEELTGFRDRDGERLFYIARPLSVNDPSCLRCHSDPSLAPENLITTYGDDGGFGWELDEVVAAQIIYVPAGEVLRTASFAFYRLMAIFVIIFALVILLINLLLKRYVIQPVSTMGNLAERISADALQSEELEAEHVTKIVQRSDELGALARVFNSMANQVVTRTRTLKQQVHQLTIEIDEIKRQQQVSEIVDTDYFQDLQSKARSLRQRRSKQPDNEAPPGNTPPPLTDSP